MAGRRSSRDSGGAPLEPQTTANILQYCMGRPRRVNSSHFGGLELYVCLQEDAIFLPPRSHHRHQHHHRHHNHHHDHHHSSSPSSQPPRREEAVEIAEVAAADDGMPQPAEETPEPEQDIEPPYSEIDDAYTSPMATLRGSVLLKVTKPTKIREVSLSFYCVGRTVWNLVPQQSVLVDTPLPSSAEVEDVAYLGIHHWDFVPLEQFGQASSSYDKGDQSATLVGQDLYGADTAIFRDSQDEVHHRKFTRTLHNSVSQLRGASQRQIPVLTPLTSQPRKLRQPSVQADGTVFPAGEYVYHFSLLIDASTPESVTVPNGHIKFFVMPRVVRPGPFTPNVQGKIEVEVVRSPPEPTEHSIGNDQVLLSRVWGDRLVYSVNLEKRYIALDTSTRLHLTLLPIPGSTVQVHQIRTYLMESVSYLYSLDSSVRSSDVSLRLLLFQAGGSAAPGTIAKSLLHPTEPTEISCDLPLLTSSDRPIQDIPQSYGRGRYGEKRFLQPDARGPYIRVKHRLVVIMRVSRESMNGRSHFEVKIDTPVVVLSRFCVHESIHLPVYGSDQVATQASALNSENGATFDEQPPSFDDALKHQLVGRPGVVPALDKPPR